MVKRLKSKWGMAGICAVVFLVVAGGTVGALMLFSSKDRVDDVPEKPEEQPVVVVPAKPVSSNVRLLLGGNVFWGRRTNTMSRASELGVAYPFSGLSTLGRENYDAWIAGLECPVTDRGHNSYEEETLLKFNCDPDYLTEATKYFTAFSLGNNHTDNQGVDGFAQTKEYLTASGIQHFGHYSYQDTGEVCGPVSVPIKVTYDDKSVKTSHIVVAFCGHHGVFGIPTADSLAEIARWAEVMPVISMPHMGTEYQPNSNALRENVYRKMIDLGADMVIGDHPHWVQNAEVYNGRLIAYSVGNFMFDQIGGTEVRQAATIEAFAQIGTIDYERWDEVAGKCLKDRATCLEVMKTSGLPKLELEWAYDVHAVWNDGKYVTSLADMNIHTAVATRLKWSQIIDAGLGIKLTD